jgi:N6-L-threonylcarbamoyladenine synthase
MGQKAKNSVEISYMKILGIESSCDDTSVALIEATENGFVVLAEKTASQIEIHKKYGGVVPEIAGRMHAEKSYQ